MSKITRRGLLQLGAVVSAATLAGCSKDDDDNNFAPISEQNNLVFDKEEKVLCSSGAFNCGSRCHHKVHVKNGRLIALTSAGDVKYSECASLDADNPDEFAKDTLATMSEGKQVQYRACARGYTYISKVYQPDRLKYPLLRDETLGLEKGDITAFRRVSWDKAMDFAVSRVKDAFDRQGSLGYIPGSGRQWIHFTLLAMFKKKFPWVWFNNNESTGNTDGAKFDSIGGTSKSNNRTDRFNSKFILTWGQDNSSTTFYQTNAYWMETKIREAGTPIVVISSTYSDAAAMLATGAQATFNEWRSTDTTAALSGEREVYQEPKDAKDLPYHEYDIANGATGAETTVDIPAWVPCRPATDGALMTAMMYVLYKRGMYDKKFLEDACFGFFPNQQITSTSPARCQSNMPIWAPKEGNVGAKTDDDIIEFGKPFTDKKMSVPTGASFQEHLESLENLTADVIPGWTNADDADKYHGVLNYAARLTGVAPELIEAIAIKYASTKPSFLEAGGGPQRAYNGVEWCWLCFCFAAMCGHTNKRGGGPGMTMYSTTDEMVYKEKVSGAWNSGSSRVNPWNGQTVAVNLSGFSHMALTGNDWRSPAQMAQDTAFQTKWYDVPGKLPSIEATIPPMMPGVDISGREKPVELDCFVVVHANYVVSQSNSNKWVEALKKFKTLIVADLHMTPTARYADVVFPITSNYESEFFGDPFIWGPTARFYHAKAIEPMYDCRTEAYFESTLWSKINDAIGISNDMMAGGVPSTFAETANPSGEKGFEAKIEPSDIYKEFVTSDVKMPTWQELKTKGFHDLTIPTDKSIIGMRDITIPGEFIPGTSTPVPAGKKLATSTGRINFFSPFWYLRMKDYLADNKMAGFRTATAKYIPNREGYEKFFADKDLKQFTGYNSPISGRNYKLLYLANKPRFRAQTVLDNVAMMKEEVKHHGVRMSSQDAAARGIKDGDRVYVYNDRGCIRVQAEVSHRLPPGVVSVEHGVWYQPSTDENEKTTIWMCTNKDNSTYESKKVPVDIGGCANTLTDDCFTLDPTFCVQTLAAQGGPCEISKRKPE